MGPTNCYRTILESIASRNYSRASQYALILQHWLNLGGLHPDGVTPVRVADVLSRLLEPACDPSALNTPFTSLTCSDCDDGQHIASLTEAIDAGWTEIRPVSNLLEATHLGLCPDCRREQDYELL
ncbi:MAG: hypothetical protein R3C19_24760 [Planctomycetaceae bacterium]